MPSQVMPSQVMPSQIMQSQIMPSQIMQSQIMHGGQGSCRERRVRNDAAGGRPASRLSAATYEPERLAHQ
jgi:hypothetical protein